MEKYLYRCDNNHEFVAENPYNCPKCGCDDFIIIGPPPCPPWKKILLGLLITFCLAVASYFLWPQACECIHPTPNHKECCDEFKGLEIDSVGISTYRIVYEEGSNYIKVISPPTDVFVELNFVLTSSGSVVYREGDKFYPCSDASFIFKWQDKDNAKIKDENKQVNNFRLTTSVHPKACESQVEYIQVKANTDCSYFISTNLPNSDIEVSLSENSGYVRSKVKWLHGDAGSNPTFFVRKIGSDIILSESESCVPDLQIPVNKDSVLNTFQSYMADCETNSKGFLDIVAPYDPEIVVRGESMKIMEFATHVMVKNDELGYLNSLKLTESNIVLNGSKTKILKLIIN